MLNLAVRKETARL